MTRMFMDVSSWFIRTCSGRALFEHGGGRLGLVLGRYGVDALNLLGQQAHGGAGVGSDVDALFAHLHGDRRLGRKLFGIGQRQSPAVERLRLGCQLAAVPQNDIDLAPHHLAVLALANERLPDPRRNDRQGEILRVAVERPGHGAAQGDAVVDSDGRIAIDRHLDLVGRQLPDSDDEPVRSRQRLLCDLAYAFRIHMASVRSGPGDSAAGPLIQQKGGTARPPPLIIDTSMQIYVFFRPLQYFRVIFR